MDKLPVVRRISAADLHRRSREIFDCIETGAEIDFLVVRNGSPSAIIIGVDRFDKMQAELDHFRKHKAEQEKIGDLEQYFVQDVDD